MDSIFTEWYNYINQKLLPVIKSTTNDLEGNILSFCYTDLSKTNTLSPAMKFESKRKNIRLIASQKEVIDVLEIGFNAGFSALLMLMSNLNIRLTCVDIGQHKYVIPCYEVLKRDFGDRINILIGDSNQVVPTIYKKFDLIHIDGCHYEHIATVDVDNCMKLCKNGTMVIMDDTDAPQLDRLWYSKIKEYNLKK